MIDIHSHILHNLDDGAEDLLESVLMSELAVEGGTHILIATPHGNIPSDYAKRSSGNNIELIMRRQKELEAALRDKGTDLKIFIGMEIFGTDDAACKITRGELLPMPDGEHYMLEFDFFMGAHEIRNILTDVMDAGARPIVAHPERYVCVQEKPDIAAEWHDMGCELQINAEGVLGRAPKKICESVSEMIDRNIITYVASDAHDAYHRTPYMRDVYELLKEVKGSAYADSVTHDNAFNNILKGII